MNKSYSRINWENYPSEDTPINEQNLNKIDFAVNEIDDRVITMDTTKLDKSTANSMVKDVSFNESTGIFTITYLNGTTRRLDTKLEKIATNFYYDYYNQKLILTLIDGTRQEIDMSALLTQYEFVNSSYISWTVSSEGEISGSIINGSITEDKLQPNFLADIKIESASASASAIAAETSATNAKTSEDNAQYYYEQTKEMTTGDTAESTVSFTSADSASPTSWTDVSVISTGEKHSALFNKISTMFKNVRYLFKMLGTTDISKIGGGSVTGATATLKDLASKLWIIPQRYQGGFFIIVYDIGEPDNNKYPPSEYGGINNLYFDVQNGNLYKTTQPDIDVYQWTLQESLRSVNESILSTVSDCTASTTSTDIAGASAVAELNDILMRKRSHVGMVIHSTTLDTMAKVIAEYGGTTWVKIEGCFLLGQSSSYAINSTGGAATVALTANNLPSHNHSVGAHSHGAGTLKADSNGEHQHSGNYVQDVASGSAKNRFTANSSDTDSGVNFTNVAGEHSHTISGSTANSSQFNTGSVGNGVAHNNMPPYKTVYIWERTA